MQKPTKTLLKLIRTQNNGLCELSDTDTCPEVSKTQFVIWKEIVSL